MRNVNIKKQEGAALAVGLFLLVILTLMGYTGMRSTMLQEKMAAGLHNRSLAQNGANSALRSGEDFLYRLVENTNGVYVVGTPAGELFGLYSHYAVSGEPLSGLNPVVEEFQKRNRNSSAGTPHFFNFSNLGTNAKLEGTPEYIVEHVKLAQQGSLGTVEFGGTDGNWSGDGSSQKIFLVTGKSQSGDGKTYAVNRSMYTVITSSRSTN